MSRCSPSWPLPLPRECLGYALLCFMCMVVYPGLQHPLYSTPCHLYTMSPNSISLM